MEPLNPYKAPKSDAAPAPDRRADGQKSGSYILGFLAGSIFVVVGLIVVYIRGRPRSMEGAVHGFLFRLALFGLSMVLGLFD